MPKPPIILQKDNEILREKAREVDQKEFGSKELSGVIEKMEVALESQYDGVAIAAPQIGESLRMFLVSWKIFAVRDGMQAEDIEDEEKKKHLMDTYENKIFINPEIIKTSKDQEWMDEGCLSVRPYYGEVKRATKCRVRAYNEKGDVFEYGGSDLLAQIFQHEIDHLNGTLFIDKARNIHELPDEKLPPSNNS